MKIRSLFLGAIAAIGVATAGFAANLDQMNPTDICSVPTLSVVDGNCSGTSLTFSLNDFLRADPLLQGSIELVTVNDFGDPTDLFDGNFIGIDALEGFGGATVEDIWINNGWFGTFGKKQAAPNDARFTTAGLSATPIVVCATADDLTVDIWTPKDLAPDRAASAAVSRMTNSDSACDTVPAHLVT